MYDLPSFISRGDFHIFVNTVFFGNFKYIHRYTSSIDASLTQPRSGSLPNALCRLFCHCSFDVREYVHRLLVYKVILPYVWGNGVICRDQSGLTELEKLLIRACRIVMDRMGIRLLPERDELLFDYGQPVLNYEEVGRSVIDVLARENGMELLNEAQQELQSHSFVSVRWVCDV